VILIVRLQPFLHGVGTQVGTSDPVFMARHNLQPLCEHPKFPYEPAHQDKLLLAGDEIALRDAFLGREWLKEMSSGIFKTWDELKFLRENWDGSLILKGIQSVSVGMTLSLTLPVLSRQLL
jgi:lactate 2-monooxygenase